MSLEVSILGLSLALIASAGWAAFDVVRKRVGEQTRATSALAMLNLWQVFALSPLLMTGALMPPAPLSAGLPRPAGRPSPADR